MEKQEIKLEVNKQKEQNEFGEETVKEKEEKY